MQSLYHLCTDWCVRSAQTLKSPKVREQFISLVFDFVTIVTIVVKILFLNLFTILYKLNFVLGVQRILLVRNIVCLC